MTWHAMTWFAVSSVELTWGELIGIVKNWTSWMVMTWVAMTCAWPPPAPQGVITGLDNFMPHKLMSKQYFLE
jgi:hypothetical protein